MNKWEDKLSMPLEGFEKTLLKQCHESKLLERVVREARYRIFREFEKASPDQRELIGHKADALAEVRRTLETIIEEAY